MYFFCMFLGFRTPGGKKATARKDRKYGGRAGRKEGRKEGGQEGRKEGRKEGREEGWCRIFVHICVGNTGSNGIFAKP